MAQPPSTTTVLIVGGGPIGLLSSILLARHGLPSVVIEKYTERLGQPKAHAINPRSLEILRQAGLDVAALRKLGASSQEAGLVRFVTAMAGKELGSLPYERQDEAALEHTPEPLFNIPQPVLEDHLRVAAQASSKALLYVPWQWEGCTQQSDGTILSTITHRKTGSTMMVQSKYVLGCDGSNASSREKFKVPFETLEGHPPTPIHYISVHLKADFSMLPPAILSFVMNDKRVEGFICYDRKDNWVFVINYDPEETPAEHFTEESCRQRLDKALGQELTYEFRRITPWYTHPRIAAQYRSATIRNAFLVGDAAHTFPSTGGLGINTGIADAHNLVWRINAIEKGWTSSDALLDRYSLERRPVAAANARQSALNQAKIGRLTEALSSSHGDLEARLSDPESKKEIDDAIEDNRDHFDSLNLQIGYVYGSELRRSCDHYVPECLPGARLAHSWVEYKGRRVSTLDLIEGTGFVLLASEDFDASHVVAGTGVPVTVLRLGKDFLNPAASWVSLMGLGPGSSGVLVRPDQHIVGKIGSGGEVEGLISQHLSKGF